MQENTPVSATDTPATGQAGYTWANDADAVTTTSAPVASMEASSKPAGSLQSGYTFATEEGNESLDHTGFAARGTLLFLMIMLLGYAIYWAYLWFIVIIERAPGV